MINLLIYINEPCILFTEGKDIKDSWIMHLTQWMYITEDADGTLWKNVYFCNECQLLVVNISAA